MVATANGTANRKKTRVDLKGLSAEEVDRLCSSMARSRQRHYHFRKNRKKMLRHLIGKHYSEASEGADMPLNVMALYQRLMLRSLIAENPRVMLSTFNREADVDVSKMQSWSNLAIKKMYLCDHLQRAITDSLYGGPGMIKVGIATAANAAATQYGVWGGKVYAESVDPDDQVFDFRARDFANCSYVGHRFRCPVKDMREIYKKALKTPSGQVRDIASSDDQNNDEGDERVGTLGRGSEASAHGSDDEFMEMADVWEVFLPRQRLVVTFYGSSGGLPGGVEDVLAVDDWVGPECGPYILLGMEHIPGNLMPKGPMQDLYDLSKGINRIVRKLLNQADRLKAVIPVRGGAVDEAGNLKQAADGEMFQADNAETLKEVVFGGPNPLLTTFLVELKNLFSWLAGNLDVLGGLSTQAGTATQEKQLNQNAGGTVGSMAEKVNTFTSKVLESLGWYWWNHPYAVMKDTYNVPGTDVVATRTLTPEDRQKTPWDEIDLMVDPFSMGGKSPEMRLAFIRGVFGELVPVMPILQQQGLYFDANYYVQQLGVYGNEPDIAKMFKIMDPQVQEAGGQGPGVGGPANPTEEPAGRGSESELTAPGQDRNMITTVMGKAAQGGANAAQNASMGSGGELGGR